MKTPVFLAGLLGVGTLFALTSRRRQPNKQTLLWPVANPKITSPFGQRINPVTKLEQFHNGVDLGGGIGTIIAAPADGVVTDLFTTTAGGMSMLIVHDNGYTTGYAHLSRYEVTKGQRVKQSQVVARMGNTGATTGPHLHLTVRDSMGNLIDPKTVMT